MKHIHLSICEHCKIGCRLLAESIFPICENRPVKEGQVLAFRVGKFDDFPGRHWTEKKET